MPRERAGILPTIVGEGIISGNPRWLRIKRKGILKTAAFIALILFTAAEIVFSITTPQKLFHAPLCLGSSFITGCCANFTSILIIYTFKELGKCYSVEDFCRIAVLIGLIIAKFIMGWRCLVDNEAKIKDLSAFPLVVDIIFYCVDYVLDPESSVVSTLKQVEQLDANKNILSEEKNKLIIDKAILEGKLEGEKSLLCNVVCYLNREIVRFNEGKGRLIKVTTELEHEKSLLGREIVRLNEEKGRLIMNMRSLIRHMKKQYKTLKHDKELLGSVMSHRYERLIRYNSQLITEKGILEREKQLLCCVMSHMGHMGRENLRLDKGILEAKGRDLELEIESWLNETNEQRENDELTVELMGLKANVTTMKNIRLVEHGGILEAKEIDMEQEPESSLNEKNEQREKDELIVESKGLKAANKEKLD